MTFIFGEALSPRPFPSPALVCIGLTSNRLLWWCGLDTNTHTPPTHPHTNQGFYYGRVYADNLFVFTITMTFALVAPLILPFALAFFVGAWVVYKRQLLFVYEPEFESGGTFFPKAFRRTVASLYLMQLALLCVLITNEAFTEIAWLAPLPVVTFLGSLVITRSYHDAAAQLPLAVAMEMDEMHKAWGETYAFLNTSYIQPALQPLAWRGGGGGGNAAKPPAGAAAAAAAAAAPSQAQRQQREAEGGEDPFSTYVPPRAGVRESETKDTETEGSGPTPVAAAAAAVGAVAEAR